MSILIFVAILVVLILAHEFGHFIVAKWSGIRVDEFSIGFGPKWFSKKVGETEYTFKPLLAGGYVKIFGEDPSQESLFGADRERSFSLQPKVIQAAVIVAGVFFNILLSWVIFSGIFMAGMPTAVSDAEYDTLTHPRVIVAEIFEESPAAIAGVASGDVVISLDAGSDHLDVTTSESVSTFIATHPTEEITISYVRGSEEGSVAVVPTANLIDGEPDRAAIGIAMGLIGEVSYPFHLALIEGGRFTVESLGLIASGLFHFFADALTLSADLSQVTGPVGIVGLVGDAASLGAVSLLLFTAFISLNLAIINILPFPALDGGRLLFVIIETVKRSPIRPSVANTMNTIGFALLILLMIAVTYHDIIRLFN